MAFTDDKYTISFADAQNRANVVYLDPDGYTGSATAVTPAEDPLAYIFGNDGDDEYRALNPTALEIRVKVDATTLFDDISGDAALSWRVRWERGGSEVWRGYLLTDEIEQPFDLPSILTLRAVCGLKELDGIVWDTATAEDSFVDHAATILAKLGGHANDIKFQANWHAYNGGSAVTGNSYSRYTFDSAAFNDPLDSTKDSVCSVALENIAGRFGGKIFFADGDWWMVQRDLLAATYTPDVRAFSGGAISTGSAVSAYTLTDAQIYSGAVRSNAPAYYKTQIGYTHFPIETGFLVNGDFSKWTGSVPDNWTEFGGGGNLTQVTRYIADADRGSPVDSALYYCEIADVAHTGSSYGDDAASNATVGIYQETAFDIQSTSHSFVLSFTASTVGNTNIALSIFYAVWINTGTNDYYWDATQNAWVDGGVGSVGGAAGKMRRSIDSSIGRQFSIEIGTPPVTGPIRVYLYNVVDYGNRVTGVRYSNVRLGYKTGDRSERVKTINVATNADKTSGLVRPESVYFIGDGPTVAHTGAIKYSGGLATGWKAGAYAASPGAGSADTGYTLDYLHANEILDQRGAPTRRLRLTFRPSSGSYWPYMPLSYESKAHSCVSLRYSARFDEYSGEWLAVESSGVTITVDEEYSDDDVRPTDLIKPLDGGKGGITLSDKPFGGFTVVGGRGSRGLNFFPRAAALSTDYSNSFTNNFLTGTVELATTASIETPDYATSGGVYIDYTKVELTSGGTVSKLQSGILSVINAGSSHGITVTGGAGTITLQTSGNSSSLVGTGWTGGNAVDLSFLASTTGDLTVGVTAGTLKFRVATGVVLSMPQTDGSANQVLKTDGSGNLDWVTQSSGVTTFLGLTDTPPSFSGTGTYFVKVNAGETALEFVANPGYITAAVTSVTAGEGLSGGTITTTGTIDVDFSGLTVGTAADWATGYTPFTTNPGGNNRYIAVGLPLASFASLSDPGADRILFWDDSAGVSTWLTVGTGLQISGTTLSSTATGTVTSVTAGEGLSGGTITTTGTIDVDFSGLTVGTAADWSTGYTPFTTNPGGNNRYIAVGLPLASFASLSDPGADRILFWDDSAGAVKWLVPDGDIYITGTSLSLDPGINKTALANTADVAVTNTTTETSLISGAVRGGTSWAANSVQTGTTFRLSAKGYYTTGASGEVTLRWKLGGVTILSVNSAGASGTLGASASAGYWEFDGWATVDTTGATGNVWCQGKMSMFNDTTGNSYVEYTGNATVSGSINFATSSAWAVTCQWTVANVSNSFVATTLTIEAQQWI